MLKFINNTHHNNKNNKKLLSSKFVCPVLSGCDNHACDIFSVGMTLLWCSTLNNP